MKKTIIILIIGMLMATTFTATAVFEWNPDKPILWRDTPTITLPDGPMFWREKPTFTVSEPVATFDPDDVVTYKWPYMRLPYPIIKWPWFDGSGFSLINDDDSDPKYIYLIDGYIIPIQYTPPSITLLNNVRAYTFDGSGFSLINDDDSDPKYIYLIDFITLPDPIVAPYNPPAVKWPRTIVPIPYEPPIIRWPLPIVPIPYDPPFIRIPYPIIVPAPINLFQ